MPPDPDILQLLKTAHPFRTLKEQSQSLLAEEVEMLIFKEGEEIYTANEVAGKFYLILNGKVKLTRYTNEGGELFGVYERGDMIGYEALVASNRYVMDATTATNEVRLISFDENLLEALFKDEPALAASMQRMYDSFLFSQRIPLHWLDEDEGIYYATLHHRMFILLRCLPPAALGLLVAAIFAVLALSYRSNLLGAIAVGSLIVFGLWFLWVWIDENNDYSIITNKRTVSIQKVLFLYETRQEIPLQSVLSNTYSTTYWGRVLGYGDIRIRTYTGSMLFRRLSGTQDVLSMLEDHRLRASQQQSREQRQEMIRFMQRRLRMLPPEEAKQQGGISTEVRQGAVTAFLNRLFRMRIVKDDAVIYRTHWFVLIKRTFIPFVLGTVLFLGILLSLIGVIPMLMGALGLIVMVLLWLGFAGWWLYKYIDWLNDKFILTNTQVMDVNKKPLGQEEKRTAALENIQEIEYRRLGIIGLLLNYGTVYMLIGTDKFTFDEVYNPSEVQYEIFNRMNAKKQKDKLEKEFREREQIAEMLEIYHTVTEAQRNKPA